MKIMAIVVGLALAIVTASRSSAQTSPRRPQATAPPRDARAVAPAGTAVIRGRVVAADTGGPLTLATITASAPGLAESRSISTNSEGRYELRSLPAGRYTLSVSHSGYLRLEYGQRRPFELGKPIDVAEATVVDDIDFVLPRMSVISGRITDEEGEPLAGAMISVMQSSAEEHRRLTPTGGFLQTDDSGAYRITGLSPGTYAVLADAGGATWTTAEGGVTRASGYAPTYFPGVSNPGAARLVTVGLGEEAPNTDFSLVPSRLATITGTVIDSRGQPVVNNTIAVVRQLAGRILVAPLAGGRTNAQGTFTLPNVAPGEITLIVGSQGSIVAGASGVPEAAIETVVVDGADMSLVLTTSEGWSASGRVVSSAGPLSVAVASRLFVGTAPVLNALRGIRIGGVGGPDPGRVDEDGTFLVTGVFGPVRLAVSGLPDGWALNEILYEGRNVLGKPVDVRDGSRASGVQIVLSNRLTMVSGQVTDGGGTPPANCTVVVFADDAERWFPGSRFVRAVRPDARGRYEIKGLPPAGYFAVAVDYVTEFMWNDPDYLESFRGRAVRFTLGDGEPQTIPLKLMAP
jgi:protocatechuate 3,4-dioxygenase beta subunit